MVPVVAQNVAKVRNLIPVGSRLRSAKITSVIGNDTVSPSPPFSNRPCLHGPYQKKRAPHGRAILGDA